MAYIDSANIKGTLYELLDTQARTDIGDLESIVNDVVTVVHSVNLLNPNTWMVGKNINQSGQLVNASTRVLSDFIPVTPGNTYYFAALTAAGRFWGPSDNKIVGLGFYSMDSAFIGKQCLILLGGILIYTGTWVLTFNRAAKQFEKYDM